MGLTDVEQSTTSDASHPPISATPDLLHTYSYSLPVKSYSGASSCIPTPSKSPREHIRSYAPNPSGSTSGPHPHNHHSPATSPKILTASSFFCLGQVIIFALPFTVHLPFAAFPTVSHHQLDR